MKITDVQICRVTLPTDRWLLVCVETDEGNRGWGEVTGSMDDHGLAALLEGLKPTLIGRNPLNIAECERPFHQWTYPVTRTIRTYSTALSGLDQALWDVTARHYGLPLYRMYGAGEKKSIPLYANLNKAIRQKRRPEDLEKNGVLAAQAGYAMLKCTPFDEVNPANVDSDLDAGFRRLEALARHVSIERIAIDCHQRFERYTLSRMLSRLLDDFGVPYWVEDPVDVKDYDAMRTVIARYPQIRWAAGEDALTYDMMNQTMQSRCYEMLMPDVKYIGGPSVVKNVMAYGEGLGFKVTLHNPNGLIATAHSAHLSALSRFETMMEYPFMAVPERELLCEPMEQVHDGRYWFSEEPGIGIELKPEVFRTYGERFVNGRWERM